MRHYRGVRFGGTDNRGHAAFGPWLRHRAIVRRTYSAELKYDL